MFEIDTVDEAIERADDILSKCEVDTEASICWRLVKAQEALADSRFSQASFHLKIASILVDQSFISDEMKDWVSDCRSYLDSVFN